MLKSVMIFETIFSLLVSIILFSIIYKQRFEIKKLSCFCDTTRTFRHDFSNIMQAIGGYIKTNNLYDLKIYYDKLIPECLKVNNLYEFHSKLMKNVAIYSIISNKYNLAENKNIKMVLNISDDLNLINLDNYNLSKILGILLDNAIEASNEAQNKLITISFLSSNKNHIIIIENTYLPKGIPSKKLYEKNFTTKPNNSGIGLWEVQNIVNKHKNLNLQTKFDSNFFTQTLSIS